MIILARPPISAAARAGFHTTCIFTGQFLSPVTSGPLIDLWSTGTTFAIFGIAAALVAVAFGALHLRKSAALPA